MESYSSCPHFKSKGACFLITHETGDSSIKHKFSIKAQPPGWWTDGSPHRWAGPLWQPLRGQLLPPVDPRLGRGALNPAETPTLQGQARTFENQPSQNL